jgi:hypothetical protein
LATCRTVIVTNRLAAATGALFYGGWTVTPAERNYAKDRYTAPHCLRYLNGYYYDFYLEHVKGGRYAWGNQRGVEFLAEAEYLGTEAEFLRGWFPDK